MKVQTLNVTVRDEEGTGPARRNRMNGNIPCVVYGGGHNPLSITANARDIELLLQSRGGTHAIVRLEFADKPEHNSPAMLKALQHHPVRSTIIHLDFQRIRLDQRITTSVPVVLTGHSKGQVEGGVVDHQLRELEVECLALEVPEEITLDITELGLNESMHVANLVVPANVTVLTDPDRAVVAIHQPRILKTAEEEAEEAEAAEGEEGEEEAEEEKE